jgi:hypothetical protein
MTQKEELVEVIEGDRYIVGLRNDDIVHVFFKPNTVINLELQNEMETVFESICAGEKKCFIYEGVGASIHVTREARKNALKMEQNLPVKASAVITRNSLQRLLADFYYFINKPKLPYNVFTKFDDGIKWLNQF